MSLYHRSIPIRVVEAIQNEAFEGLQRKDEVFYHKDMLHRRYEYEVSDSSRVLSLRLHDNDRDIVGTELDAEEWQASAVEVFQLDLKKQFSNAAVLSDTCYDTVLAIDVIEHLEYPRVFLEDVKKLLNPSGLLILSVPIAFGFEYRRKIYKQCTRCWGGLTDYWPMTHCWLLEEVLIPEANLEKLGSISSSISNQPRWIASLKGFLLIFFAGLNTRGIGVEWYVLYYLRKR
ncbi:methyltransferase domain-containing protein [Phormidium tenue FACHB-886]|nr:methyltransferase domain-containing protein [Phormidium tenue FACHB-886]